MIAGLVIGFAAGLGVSVVLFVLAAYGKLR